LFFSYVGEPVRAAFTRRCAQLDSLDCHRSVRSSVNPQARTCVVELLVRDGGSPAGGGGRDGGNGRRVPASPDTPKTEGRARETRETVTFADVLNSTHTGCLSHCTIEGAELSIPRARLSRGFAKEREKKQKLPKREGK